MKRNSIPFRDIESLANGFKLERKVEARFFRSLGNLQITIKSALVTISRNYTKKLGLDKCYEPVNLDTFKKDNLRDAVFFLAVKYLNGLKQAIKYIS